MTVAEINKLIQGLPSEERGKVSDGYHSFDEYNKHRDQLWITVCSLQNDLDEARFPFNTTRMYIWRSKLHSDGSKFDGYFVLGMCRHDNSNQITYHLPLSKWEECSFADTVDKSPKWDGHTSNNVLSRLKLI